MKRSRWIEVGTYDSGIYKGGSFSKLIQIRWLCHFHTYSCIFQLSDFDHKLKMALIGHVFNRVLNKYIPVYIAESGNGFIRLTAYIDQKVKDAAFATVKAPFENGKLFKDDDMKQMEQLSITWVTNSVNLRYLD